MDKATARRIRCDVEAAIDDVAERHGLTRKPKGCRYGDGMWSMKLELVGLDEGVDSPEAQDFITHAPLYGLKEEDLGRTFVSRGKTFMVTGLKPRSSKYPVIAERKSDGRKFKFEVDFVRERL